MSALARKQLAELNKLLEGSGDEGATPVQRILRGLTPEGDASRALIDIIDTSANDVLVMHGACRDGQEMDSVESSLWAIAGRLKAASALAHLLQQAGRP